MYQIYIGQKPRPSVLEKVINLLQKRRPRKNPKGNGTVTHQPKPELVQNFNLLYSKSKTRNRKPEIENSKSKSQNRKLETENSKSKAQNRKLEIENSKSKTQNRKLKIENSKSKTRNRKLEIQNSQRTRTQKIKKGPGPDPDPKIFGPGQPCCVPPNDTQDQIFK